MSKGPEKKFSSFKRKTLFIGASIATLTIAASSVIPGPASAVNPPQEGTLASQISRDVQRALRANREALTYSEWQRSGYTPHDVIENVLSLKSPSATTELCKQLGALVGEDLALFDSAIDHDAGNLHCADKLQTKLDMHWMIQRMGIENQRQHAQVRSFPPGAGPAAAPQLEISLPSREVHIDPSQTSLLTSGDLKPGEIAITLDDGPHPTRTARILKILKDAGVRANFFELGEKARAYPSVSKLAADQGNIMGSHSWDHPDLKRLALDEAEHQITSGRDQVALVTETHIPFFRFPYGSYNRALQSFIQKENMVNFFWNMDSMDWKIRDPKALFQNVLKELNRERRGIILFHDIHEQTVIVLPLLFDELRARGFTTAVFVPH